MNHQKFAIESIPEITQRILAVSTPRKIILFGSFARGDYDSGSDIDILVILDEVEPIDIETKRIYKALLGLGVPVDIIVTRTAYVQRYGDLIGSVVRPALIEGKVLYA